MSVELALLYIRLALSGAIVALGLAVMLGGALGVLRFPDFYTRLHAANAGDGVGGVVVLIGMLIASPTQDFAIRLALLAALWAIAHPTLTQMQAKAAHVGGLSPIAGPYSASAERKH
ncbi:MAG: monovalent cation/H(+) antiporter subunit G [Pseudomonadota bacterium]